MAELPLRIQSTNDSYDARCVRDETVVSLYLADTAQAKLLKEVATGFDTNGKVIWHKDHRSYYDMDFILTEPSSKDQLKLVISVCDIWKRKTREGLTKMCNTFTTICPTTENGRAVDVP